LASTGAQENVHHGDALGRFPDESGQAVGTCEEVVLAAPLARITLKLNGHTVPPHIMTHVIIFLLLYIMIFILGSVVMSAMGYDFLTSIGAVATSLGNVGPGIGKIGPVDNFAWLSDPAKWLLSFLMLLGRLKLFTILLLMTPYFWKSN